MLLGFERHSTTYPVAFTSGTNVQYPHCPFTRLYSFVKPPEFIRGAPTSDVLETVALEPFVTKFVVSSGARIHLPGFSQKVPVYGISVPYTSILSKKFIS
jgi:hypothetical protein